MSAQPANTTPRASANASLAELCQDAIRLLDESLKLSPPELGEEVDMTERAAVRLRDALIERVRQPDGAAAYRPALNQVNAALSLIAGVEYPATGVMKKMLEQARDALRQVQGSGVL